MARVIIGPDIQSQLCPFLYEGTLAPIIDRGLEIPEADETGHIIASIRTPKALSVLALTCKTFHAELQKYRNLQLRLLAQKFLDVSPKHDLELINVDSYDPACFSHAPTESILLWRVFLGSRLHVAITLMRQRQGEDELDPQRLIVQVGARRNLIGAPEVSAQLVVEPDPLCYLSGWDFEGDQDDQYNAWFDQTSAQVHAWLHQQYQTRCGPLV
jgi:hypothetical protein